MDFLLNLIPENILVWIGAIGTLLGGLYGLFLLIPGNQPDKIIKIVYDITKKISKK